MSEYEYEPEDGWNRASDPELETFNPPLRPRQHHVFLSIRPSGSKTGRRKGRTIGIATVPSLGRTVTVVNFRPDNLHKAKKGWTFWTGSKHVPDGWYDNRRSPVMREHWVGNAMVERYDSCDCVPYRPAEMGGLMPPWGHYPDLPLNQ